MIALNPTRYLDERNIELWNNLSSKFKIEVFTAVTDHDHCYSINKDVEIYLNPKRANSASLTHELLHVWLRDLEVFIGSSFQLSFPDNKKMRKIISKKLLLQLGDWFDHVKMFPKFIELGYDKSDFLYDNSLNKFTLKDAKRIKRNFKYFGIYISNTIDYFIGKYFSAKADVSSPFDYSINYSFLADTDYKLFEILENTWEMWLNLNIHSQDILDVQYFEVPSFLFDQLLLWAEDKRIN